MTKELVETLEAPFKYAVLLGGPEHFRLDRLANALGAFRDVPFADAARMARTAWGIPADDMAKDEALALCARLETSGLKAVALPNNLIEELPQPALAVSAEFEHGGLRLCLKSGDDDLLAWDRMALVAAAGFRPDEDRAAPREEPGPPARPIGFGLAAGSPVAVGSKRGRADSRRTDFLFFLDIYLRKPVRRWRIDGHRFNYSCLKSVMSYSEFANFRTLIGAVIQAAPAAGRSRGTTVLAEGLPVTAMGYDRIEDLERESRWLLTLGTLKDPWN